MKPSARQNVRRAGARFAHSQKSLALGTRLVGGIEQGVLSLIAALLAWIPTQALGLREGFWASITAVAVAQTELNALSSTARDQLIGAAVGGLVAAGLSLVLGSGVLGFCIAVVAAIGGCWALNVASAARLSGITAIIIFLVPHHGGMIRMTVSRVGEVGWGVLMAIMVMWIWTRTKKGFLN